MANRSEATLSHGLVRRAIDFRRCSWVRPLVSDYVERFDALAPLFAGNPADPDAWRQAIARVQPAARHREAVASALASQLDRRGAPAQARDAAAALADPTSVAVVTGQQAGVFGGPLYTLLKAVTAIQIAARLRDDHRVPAVPVFWVDAEDHDWNEIRTATVLNREYEGVNVSMPPVRGAGTHPVGSLVLDDGIAAAITELEAALAESEFKAGVLDSLRRRYRPGETVGAAFAGWMDDLLGRHGLVVFEAADPRLKPAVSDLFVAELDAPTRTSQLVRDAAAAIARLGHAAQVEPPPDGVNLFYLNGSGRLPVRARDGQFVVGDAPRSRSELVAEASAHPERFSPNVVLRPIVQDRLFPTVCYVAGPSELAYHAQLGGVYRAFGVPPPLLHSRVSATIIDSASARFLERYDVPFESLQAQDESALNQLLERQLPPAVEGLIHDIQQQMAAQARALKDAVSAVDPTLAGAVDTTARNISETLRSLQNKIVHASKKKDETLRRQFRRTRELAFPGGEPQERSLNLVYFVNRYGPAVVDRLIDELPRTSNCHYVLTL